MTAPQFLAKLKIENFPSRVELLTLIDNYLSSNGLPSNYKAINQDNQILLMLHNPDIAYSIIRKLKIEQTKNNLYLKIKIIHKLFSKSIINLIIFSNLYYVNIILLSTTNYYLSLS